MGPTRSDTTPTVHPEFMILSIALAVRSLLKRFNFGRLSLWTAIVGLSGR